MKGLRNSIAAIIFVFALSAWGFSSATNVYITPNGSPQGSCTTNPQTPAWFNNSANWGSGSSQIGPGTTVTICGTFTGSAGSTEFTFQGSGTSGNPITFIFDTGATLSAPYWSGTNGAINTNGHSYITIDGAGAGSAGAIPTTFKSNGIIQNTANGTSLAYQQPSHGISLGNSSYVIIENLTMANIYQRTGHATEAFDDTTAQCVNWSSSANNIKVDNNLFHDGGWCINGNGDNITWSNNELYNFEHSIIGAPVHFWMFGNHLHDWALWDAPCSNGPCAYHHDGFHCFAGSGGNTVAGYIYSNQFDGATNSGVSGDGQMNEFIFIEGGGSSTTCMVPGGKLAIFNNVMIADSTIPQLSNDTGNSSAGDSGDIFANNTVLDVNPGDETGCMVFQYSQSATVANNAIGGCGMLAAGGQGAPSFSIFDFNAYENCTSNNCFYMDSVDTPLFAVWQASTVGGVKPDGHGIASVASKNYFNLSSGCVPGSVGASCAPNSGSPLIAAGKNLYSMCNGQPNPGLGALCSDKNGIPRPATGAWDAGAYAYSSSPPPTPPTQLAATVN